MVTKATRGGSLTVKPKGKFLLFLRQREPYRTQKQVEDDAGIPNLSLSRYERGKPICLEHLDRLARFYGMPARELVEPDSLSSAISLTRDLFNILSLEPSEL